MSASPHTVSEILCRELGAKHPDGALQQIRTMKRVLRAHYHVHKRLQALGVEQIGDAVGTIATLRKQIHALKADQKEQAREHLSVTGEVMEALDQIRSMMYGAGAPEKKAQAPSQSTTVPASGINNLPPEEALRVLQSALDELRLELWADPSKPDVDAANLSTAEDAVTPDQALEALRSSLRDLAKHRPDVQKENEVLQKENEALEEENEQLRLRLRAVERTFYQQKHKLQSIAQRFSKSESLGTSVLEDAHEAA
ncbi:hypothetical protein [Salisaeta longa]|uniref:hypothetical protein n=1 Tax=Salisaeta longa TaxID=503170 RepID=UPI0012FA42D9|nr:hypothetical protein [Salisaeta longa]